MKPAHQKTHLLLFRFALLLIFQTGTQFETVAQGCGTLNFTYTTKESRCVATGEIVVMVSGGVGPFNFEVTGPINPPITSSNIITGLPPGAYTVTVRDVGTPGCAVTQTNIIVTGSYSAPSFTLSKVNATCLGNNGMIAVNTLSGGRAPFIYRIGAGSASGIGTTSSTGNFTNLVPGNYNIILEDSCGNIQTRNESITAFTWSVNTVNVTMVGCDSADVTIRLADGSGNVNTSGTAFNGFLYGLVNAPGDTTWVNNHMFRFLMQNKRVVNVVAKDPCGVIKPGSWVLPAAQMPGVGSVMFSNQLCNTFTATVSNQQNLTDPLFCFYNSANVQVGCNNSGVFNNIPYGPYCIRVFDNCFDTTIVRCFISRPTAPSVNAAVGLSNQNCNTFTASITGQANLSSPVYCLLNANNDTISCNATGVFTGLDYGNYCIRIKDACYDTTISRCFTSSRPAPFINAVRVTSASCNSLEVDLAGQANLGNGRFCLYNGNMVLIECNNTGIFTNIPQGNYCIRTISDCGDTSAPYCVDTRVNRPVVGANVIVTNRRCNKIDVSVGGTSNLNNPEFCLINSNNQIDSCNTTGIFTNIPYGSYCIRVKNDPLCYDTTIIRCFSEAKPPITVTANLTQSNTTCSTFTATITGTGLTTPTYNLYNSSNALIGTNTSGIFNNLSYGTYCVDVVDACDTTIRVCQTFQPQRGVTLSSYVTCTIGAATVAAQMQSRNNPYTFQFYHPDGRLLHTVANTWSNWVSVDLPALPAGTQYKVVGIDNCGRRDSAYVTPVATIVNRNVVISPRCPSGIWPDGSSDIAVTVTSNLFTTTPRLFKKDEVIINQNHNSRAGNTFHFMNQGPGTYIIEYTMQQCNSRTYDTVIVGPYVNPVQRNSAIYQCDNNSFTVNTDAVNGIGPFTYAIIASSPATPSIIAGPQPNPFFTINNGTTYSLARLRAVDACGNAALADAAVLPLGNVVITADRRCLFENITLSATAIPNAVYQWYKKTSPTDSALVGTGLSFNIPFMTNDDRATYVSRVTVNNDCLTRLSYTTLDGQCHNEVLPVHIQLHGNIINNSHLIQWSMDNDRVIYSITIERKLRGATAFSILREYVHQEFNDRQFFDEQPPAGISSYRLKVTTKSGKTFYSNLVSLDNGEQGNMSVFPNPVKNEFVVSINNRSVESYSMVLFDATGRTVMTHAFSNITTVNQVFKRNGLKSGIYVLQIRNLADNRKEIFKLILN
jgi:hypothetical protein